MSRFFFNATATNAIDTYLHTLSPHDALPILLAEIDRKLAGESHRLRIVAVDVEDRRLDALGDVRRIGRGPGEGRTRRETELVIDDEMDAADGVVAGHAQIGRASCRGRVCQYV